MRDTSLRLIPLFCETGILNKDEVERIAAKASVASAGEEKQADFWKTLGSIMNYDLLSPLQKQAMRAAPEGQPPRPAPLLDAAEIEFLVREHKRDTLDLLNELAAAELLTKADMEDFKQKAASWKGPAERSGDPGRTPWA